MKKILFPFPFLFLALAIAGCATVPAQRPAALAMMDSLRRQAPEKSLSAEYRSIEEAFNKAEFLLQAVKPAWPIVHAVPWWALSERMVRALDLFDRIERRQWYRVQP